MDIILASASPRRRELLDQIGIRYHVQPVDLDESALPDESPEALVQRLALQKAQAGWENSDKLLPVLGADTLGVLTGTFKKSSEEASSRLLVKPRNYEHAYDMLKRMSGSCHQILSAVAIRHHQGHDVRLNTNNVFFKTLTDKEIKAYWETGEPQDKAGAYAIQGYAAVFIKRIEGSYSGVMGLPLYETQQLLASINITET